MSTLVRLFIRPPTKSGARIGWFKHVTAVDRSLRNGYAFDGTFLGPGEHDLPVGSVVIEKAPQGSVRNGWDSGRVLRVTPEGTLEEIFRVADWRTEFLSLRDAAADALEAQPNPLAEFSDAVLLAECRRRGLLPA